MAIAARDWRDESYYLRLLRGDRRCFAWEWLRRTPAYVAAWRTGFPSMPFGLERLEDPAKDAVVARLLWSKRIDRGVLEADASLDDDGDRLDFAPLAPLVTVAAGGDHILHMLLSDGLQSIRLDLRADNLLTTPIALTWRLTGVKDLGPKLAALAQFSALVRLGRFSRALHPAERRARRWIAMLRVHDGLASGATTRELVAGLFDVDTAQARWRADAAPWRLRVQRLVSAARRALVIGPAAWLNGQFG